MEKKLGLCAAGGECKGSCPEARLKRTKTGCPAFYEKIIDQRKQKPKYDDQELMEE